MAVVVGLAAASRNGAVAICDAGDVVGMCEHERVTRTRREPLAPGKLPTQTISTVLRIGQYSETDVEAYAVAERRLMLPAALPVEYVDHHLAHAATAFYTSQLPNATVVVCDRGEEPELSVWTADEGGLRRADFEWHGPGLATLYSLSAESIGFSSESEDSLEALARVGKPRRQRHLA